MKSHPARESKKGEEAFAIDSSAHLNRNFDSRWALFATNADAVLNSDIAQILNGLPSPI